jgi:hypothetical protein
VVDYHVDRPEVEAPQGVELTGTNRSDILTNACHRGTESSSLYSFADFPARLARAPARHRARGPRNKVSGAHGGGVPPVPIPNTAVKPASADDSLAAGPLESRTVPDLVQGARRFNAAGFSRCYKLFGRASAAPAEPSVGVPPVQAAGDRYRLRTDAPRCDNRSRCSIGHVLPLSLESRQNL